MNLFRTGITCAIVLLTIIAFTGLGFTTSPALNAPASNQSTIQETSDVTEINSCTTITEPGHYKLNTDLENTSATQDTGIPADGANVSACIVIQSDNVVFNGNGHTVDGKGFGDVNATDDSEVFNETELLTFPSGVAVRGANGQTLSNVTVTDVETTDWFLGVLFDNVTNADLSETTASNNANLGIELLGVTDSAIANNTANRNDFAGLYTATSKNNTIAGNTMLDNGIVGIDLFFRSDGNHLLDNTVSGSAVGGIAVIQAANTTIERNTISNIAGDDSLTGFSGGIVLIGTGGTHVMNTTTTNTEQWDVYTTGCENTPGTCLIGDDIPDPSITPPKQTPTTVENLTLGSATISFVGEDVAIDAVDSPPATLTGQTDIGQYVNTTGLGNNSSLSPITFHYADDELGGMSETELNMYRYDAESEEWTIICDEFTRDTDANTVSVHTDEFGIIAPFVNNDSNATA